MKKFLSVAILAFSFIIFANSAQAFEVKVDNSVNLNKEEIADGNVYASCGDMKIDGTVNGDLIAMCKSIVVNGTINGDLIAFSQDITINGEVKGSVRVAGTNLTVSGTVDHNINSFGTEINLTPSSTVAWDVLVAGVNGNFNGIIGGNLHGNIAAASIAGKIGKNVDLKVEDSNNSNSGLLITKDAIIGGDLTYTAKREVKIESPSSIVGVTSHQKETSETETPINIITKIFYKLSALILIGLILISLKKKVFYTVAKILETKNWQATLIGLGLLILMPIVILFFSLTIIGIPLALILLAAYLIMLPISAIFCSFFVSDLIIKNTYKKPINAFVTLIIGLIIFTLLASIPYLGWSFVLVFITYGLGGILINIKNHLYD
jgi:cytoskeletal protein CcmA (bactofilin family)